MNAQHGSRGACDADYDPQDVLRVAECIMGSMEIHAPEKPIEGFRDFIVHIGIVTLGILIALSLEGLRENIHDRHVVLETRENFRRELEIDRDHAQQEMARVRQVQANLKTVISDIGSLSGNPAALDQKLLSVRNSGYFFLFDSWQTALSTGGLAHMPSEEVLKYAGADYDIRYYSNLQQGALTAEGAARVYFRSHPKPNAQELREGTEKLMLFEQAEEGLAYVGQQLQASIEDGYKAANQQ